MITRSWFTRAWLALSVLTGSARADEKVAGADASVFGQFVGSTPCSKSICSLFQIPPDTEPPLRWQLTLRQDPKTQAPAGYELRCDCPSTTQEASAERKRSTVEREGRWRLAKGTKSNPDAVVYELQGALSLSLLEVDRNILHLLNPDRSLMIGTGGWSYSLNRLEAAEEPGDLALALSRPSQSYTVPPVASGPAVFGVFVGRSPCRGIARELNLADDAGCLKVKWRVTLFHDPETLAPTTYTVVGSLHRQGTREGKWSLLRSNDGERKAIVYRLEPFKTEAALHLLKGDENVLFFLDRNQKPLVGHADSSYTLNRRETSESPSTPKPAD